MASPEQPQRGTDSGAEHSFNTHAYDPAQDNFPSYQPSPGGQQPAKQRGNWLVISLGVVAIVAIAAAVVLINVFDSQQAAAQAKPAPQRDVTQDWPKTAKLAGTFAKAINDADAQKLAEITCVKPTKAQVAAHDKYNDPLSISNEIQLADRPVVRGDQAKGHVRQGDKAKVIEYTLTFKNGSWCAEYNWVNATKPPK